MYYEGYPQKLQKKTLEKSNGVTSRLYDALCKYLDYTFNCKSTSSMLATASYTGS